MPSLSVVAPEYDFYPILCKEDIKKLPSEKPVFSEELFWDKWNTLLPLGNLPIEDELHKINVVPIKNQLLDQSQIDDALKKDSKNSCVFLAVAFHEKRLVASLVIRFFPPSCTLLIESILLAQPQDLSDNKDPLELKKSTQYLFNQLIHTQARTERKNRTHNTVLANFINRFEYIICKQITKEKNLNESYTKIQGVFFQAADPIEMRGSHREETSNVLQMFYEADARYIHFDYHIPILPNFKTHKYLLLTFPSVLNKSQKEYIDLEMDVDLKTLISFRTVMEFIIDYKRYLASIFDKRGIESDYENDWKEYRTFNEDKIDPSEFDIAKSPFEKSYNSLYENLHAKPAPWLYLHRIPRLEEPRFKYKRASVCFEIIVDEDYFEPDNLDNYHQMKAKEPVFTLLGKIRKIVGDEWGRSKLPPTEILYCPVTHSVETDLFSYKYQSNPPYYTRHFAIPPSKEKITIDFPSMFAFTSEGRKESYYRIPTHDVADDADYTYSVNMEVRVSYTFFLNSRIRVWHLVLKTADEDAETTAISEMDIIKLMRFFSGSQENEDDVSRRNVMRQIRFNEQQPKANKAVKRERFPLLDIKRHDKNIWEYVVRMALRALKALVKSPFWLIGGVFRMLEDIGEELSKRYNRLFIKEDVPDELSKMNNVDNLIQLLEDLTGVSYKKRKRNKYSTKYERSIDKEDQIVSLRNVRSGIVEIDTGHQLDKASKKNEFLDFYSHPVKTLIDDEKTEIREKVTDFYKNLHDGEIGDLESGEPFSLEEYANYVFKAYCGIALGILDFDRMGIQEIDDTLVPLKESKTEESFQSIHRGVIGWFGQDDSVLDSFWDTLGINPYLLIPSAVLAHNDFVARDADDRLTPLLEMLRNNTSSYSIAELVKQRNEIDNLLNDDILGNVFQYKTEIELFDEGMKRRGIEGRIEDAKAKLDQLDKIIDNKQEERTNKYQRRIQFLATIVGIINFYAVINSFYKDELSKPKSNLNAQKEEIDRGVIVTDSVDKEIDWSKLKKLPDWVRNVVDWISTHIHFDIIKWLKSDNEPDQLAHKTMLITVSLFILYLLLTNLFDPTHSRPRLWQRKSNRN